MTFGWPFFGLYGSVSGSTWKVCVCVCVCVFVCVCVPPRMINAACQGEHVRVCVCVCVCVPP
jgi:hypothetical protein